MKYTAKGLETEPYKAYSRDAFNDEEKGVNIVFGIKKNLETIAVSRFLYGKLHQLRYQRFF